jgi:hypothetical protein
LPLQRGFRLPNKFIEQRAIVDHRLAQILRARLAALLAKAASDSFVDA